MKKKYIIIWTIMAIVTIALTLVIIFYPRKYLYIYKDKFTIDYNELGSEKGYSWYYEQSNDNLINTTAEKDKWVFIPNKNGKVEITFYYKLNPNIDEYLYKINYQLKIRNNKIYWLSGEGKGLLYYPNPY